MDSVPLCPPTIASASLSAVTTGLVISIIILILFSAFFSAAETAYASANRIRLRNMENNGSKRAGKVLKQLDNYQRFINTVLVGNNIVNITAASLGTLLFTLLIKDNPTLSTTVSTAAITFSILLFGEIVPKSVAKENAEKAALIFQPVVSFLEIILLPFGWFFGLWRKIYKPKKAEAINSDELITIVEEAQTGGEIDENESLLIRSAIEFDDVEVYDVMVPRVNIIAIEDSFSNDSIAEIFLKHEFSRLPVYHGSPDSIIGILHEKDFYKVLRKDAEFKDVLTPPICLSRNMKISDALRTMQKAKAHMAIVLDEFGGTNGIVTMEDILEELVGEIYDEHDEEEDLFRKTGEKTYVVSGAYDLEDMFDSLGIAYNDEFESTSAGGWVTEYLRRIPLTGDTFTYKNLEVTISKADERKVSEITINIIENQIDQSEGD